MMIPVVPATYVSIKTFLFIFISGFSWNYFKHEKKGKNHNQVKFKCNNLFNRMWKNLIISTCGSLPTCR